MYCQRLWFTRNGIKLSLQDNGVCVCVCYWYVHSLTPFRMQLIGYNQILRGNYVKSQIIYLCSISNLQMYKFKLY